MSSAKAVAKAAAAAAASAPSLSITPRRSSERGHARPTWWLNTYHTFSFANYYDPEFSGFNCLRVLNEDRVERNEELSGKDALVGFGPHSHSRYAIFSIPIAGTMLHKDSFGNTEFLSPDDVQMTHAGQGITHAEYNGGTKVLHFLQIWVKSDEREASYETKSFPAESKKNALKLIVSPGGRDGSVHLKADLDVYHTVLDAGKSVQLPVRPGREYYVHVVDDVLGFETRVAETGVLLNDVESLGSGDGAFLRASGNDVADDERVVITAAPKNPAKPTQVILFDMAKEG